MKIETSMCYTHLMSMLMMPEQFQKAIHSYLSSAPNIEHEGIAGYIETNVVFEVRDLTAFTDLWNKAYTFPSDRQGFYQKLKSGLMCS